MDLRVADDSGAPIRFGFAGLKLWFHESNNPAPFPQQSGGRGKNLFQRDERAVDGDEIDGPLGALGVPLAAGRTIAVYPRFIPLGAPVYVSTTWPLSSRPLNRLMLAQDTGGAIRGPVRADWFWGFGENAAQQAGRMKQEGRLWLLWPKGAPLPD